MIPVAVTTLSVCSQLFETYMAIQEVAKYKQLYADNKEFNTSQKADAAAQATFVLMAALNTALIFGGGAKLRLGSKVLVGVADVCKNVTTKVAKDEDLWTLDNAVSIAVVVLRNAGNFGDAVSTAYPELSCSEKIAETASLISATSHSLKLVKEVCVYMDARKRMEKLKKKG